MSFLESIFTPPGTNARRAQDDRNREIAGLSMDLLKQYWPTIQKQFKLRDEMQPQIEAMIRQAIASRSQKNVLGRANAMRAGATSGATRTARQVGNAGGSPGLAKGAMIAHLNQGHTATNEYLAGQYDPQKQFEQDAGIMQLINAATQPDLNVANSLGGLVYGQPQTHVGPGIAETVGMIAGQYVGGKTSSGKW